MTTMEEVAGWLREAANQQTIIARTYHKLGWSEHSHDAETLGEYFNDRAAEVEAMGWRPIEDCPKDGTSVDLWNSSSEKRLTDCRWDGNNRWIRLKENAFGVMAWCVVKGKITHFMPRPQPPMKKWPCRSSSI